MSEKRWTEPQQMAIEDRGGSLLISAAAGSGKTAVLVERAVGMMTREDQPISADRLLIVTFTNAAAAELRGRLALRLELELRRHPGNLQLQRQRLQLRRAFIGTIDAFCQQFVREHFQALGLPADIGVGEEALLAQLSAGALAETMEESYQDEAFAALSAMYGQARSDRTAEEAVRSLYDHVTTLPAPAAQLRRFAAMYDEVDSVSGSPWGRVLLEGAATALAEAARLAALSLQLAEDSEVLQPYLPALEADAQTLEALLAGLNEGWDALCRRVEGVSFLPLASVRKEDDAKLVIQDQRKTVKAIVEDLKKNCFVCTEEEFLADCRRSGPMVKALCTATQDYLERYTEAKKAERVLDFADFEHLALQLLQNEDGSRTPLAGQVSSRYDAVMVDEYQDTNDLQNALYSCLAKADGSNLFFVGDVKQSIYRFRKANPGIFLEKKDRWPACGQGLYPAQISLGHNFRSAQGVVDSVNYLFGRLMSLPLGELDYSGDERLICGAPEGPEGSFGLHVVEGTSEDEAAFVARRIGALVAAGEMVKEGDGLRPCHYGDFCILFRARKQMPVFAAALEAEGIPLMVDYADSLLKAPEVVPLSAALGAINNPGDDVSLAAMMLGPLFGFTPDELTRLRAGDPRGRLWAALVASKDDKAKEFLDEFVYYRSLAGEVPVGRLCEELCGRTGYLSAVAAMEGGSARRENLLRFIGWAASCTAGGRGGLAGFVRLMESGSGPAMPGVKTIPGHVTLLSIHKSKGLEFPFVFLADADHRFLLSSLGDRVQMHAALGIGLVLRSGDHLYPTLPALAIRSRAMQEELSEEMRLLYVALTRAKQGAAVCFALKDPEKKLGEMAAFAGGNPSPFGLSRKRSMADWLMAAALAHPDARPFLQRLGIPCQTAPAAEGRFTFTVEKPHQGEGRKAGPFRLTALPDEALTGALAASFGQQPPRRLLVGVPAKISVSALSKGEAPSLRKRPSFMYSSGLSAAERGTAMHSFLQFADFAAAGRDFEGERRRLVEGGFISAEMAGAVEEAGVRAFLSSQLAGRIGHARRVLREYDFITSVPASALREDLPAPLAAQPVLVQGIADLVLVFDGYAEIADYKTDKSTTPEALIKRYSRQLGLYTAAVEKSLRLPVKRVVIWSFSLLREIELDPARLASSAEA